MKIACFNGLMRTQGVSFIEEFSLAYPVTLSGSFKCYFFPLISRSIDFPGNIFPTVGCNSSLCPKGKRTSFLLKSDIQHILGNLKLLRYKPENHLYFLSLFYESSHSVTSHWVASVQWDCFCWFHGSATRCCRSCSSFLILWHFSFCIPLKKRDWFILTGLPVLP